MSKMFAVKEVYTFMKNGVEREFDQLSFMYNDLEKAKKHLENISKQCAKRMKHEFDCMIKDENFNEKLEINFDKENFNLVCNYKEEEMFLKACIEERQF